MLRTHLQAFPKVKQKFVHKKTFISITIRKSLMSHFMSLAGCFLDFFEGSTGMGIVSGGGRSAVRSSSPKMAACWEKSMSCMKDMLRFSAKRRSWTQSEREREKGVWQWCLALVTLGTKICIWLYNADNDWLHAHTFLEFQIQMSHNAMKTSNHSAVWIIVFWRHTHS